MQVVHEKPEPRMHVVFMHKTRDEQRAPINEHGKHAIRKTGVPKEQHDNHVYVGGVQYFLEVIHTIPSVPHITLVIVCRLHAAERMVMGSPSALV
eukprot:jgi/Tetstr1/421900/TSEL_012800.t1